MFVGSASLLLGLVLLTASLIGVLRLRDTYSRLHALGGPGAGCLHRPAVARAPGGATAVTLWCCRRSRRLVTLSCKDLAPHLPCLA
ncbi:MAG: monovalent cation/H(+) antiporter subunit G [Actinomycetota bacterium]|nr:monovalent cation/H(+) antiporter subunit G [Actinomycetota bacterium]